MRLARALVIALAAVLAGCVGAFPRAALENVNPQATVAAMRADITPFVGQRVLVGGEILSTEPRPEQTEIVLLARPLRFDDSPQPWTDETGGRALVRTAGFLDPAVYAKGRRITVVGRVTGAEDRSIGDLPYRYPVIESDHIRLWRPDPPVSAYPYPYPYTPWWPWAIGPRYMYGPPPPYPYWWW